jgi:hypothetical protein
MPPSRKTWLKRGLGLALGAAAGFAYYHFVGCTSGGCPIWADPVVSTAFGGVFGALTLW